MRRLADGLQYISAAMDGGLLEECRAKASALGVAVPDNATYMDWRVSFTYVRAVRSSNPHTHAGMRAIVARLVVPGRPIPVGRADAEMRRERIHAECAPDAAAERRADRLPGRSA